MASSLAAPMKLLDVANTLEALSVTQTRELCFKLGVPLPDLDDIDEEFRDSASRKRHFLQRWLNTDMEAGWGKLAAGLRQIGLNALAAKVESEHSILPTASGSVPSLPPVTSATKSSEAMSTNPHHHCSPVEALPVLTQSDPSSSASHSPPQNSSPPVTSTSGLPSNVSTEAPDSAYAQAQLMQIYPDNQRLLNDNVSRGSDDVYGSECDDMFDPEGEDNDDDLW